MTEIDWSKAPDDATHWAPEPDSTWVRCREHGGDSVVVSFDIKVDHPDGEQWSWCTYTHDPREAAKLIPRPARTCPRPDPVNHPEHYTAGGIECIDAIEAALTPEEFRGYCKGNALKYVWRERHKGGDESLRKARWYLTKLTNNED